MPTLHEKIGQMLVVGFEGTQAPAHILDWLYEGRIGGVILFARNIETPEQVAALTTQIREAATFPPIIAIDQEGGTVARLREGFSESPGAMALAAGQDAETTTRRVSQVLGDEMRALGINWTFAPVVDLTYNAGNPTVGTRSFGDDPDRVGALAAAAVAGFQAGGVAACAKHFPGLGNTAVDTHLALPALDTSVAHLTAHDLPPYRRTIAAGVASVMTTHTIFTALDDQHPATLSPVVVKKLLRDDLRFDGVVVTDCLEMKAISDHYGTGEAAVLAALADIDIVLVSHTQSMQEDAYNALIAATDTGRLSAERIDAAYERITAMKAQFPALAPDVSAVHTPDHLTIVRQAARDAVVQIGNPDHLLPLTDDGVLLVELQGRGVDSIVNEAATRSKLAHLLADRLPGIETVSLTGLNEADTATVEQAVRAAETVVIATRSAHLNPARLAAAQRLINAGERVILLCLRNPYDAAALTSADLVLCTNGDSLPSLEAAVAALTGDFMPTGTLPISLELV